MCFTTFQNMEMRVTLKYDTQQSTFDNPRGGNVMKDCQIKIETKAKKQTEKYNRKICPN